MLTKVFLFAILYSGLLVFFPVEGMAAAPIAVTANLLEQSDAGQRVTRVMFRVGAVKGGRIEVRGNELVVKFSQPVKISFAETLYQLRAVVYRASLSNDAMTLTLGMKQPPAKYRIIAGSDFIGLDILRPREPVIRYEPANNELVAATPKNIPSIAQTESTENTEALSEPLSQDEATLVFPFSQRVGAAVFKRNEQLWVVFDTPKYYDMNAVVASANSFIASAEQTRSVGNTVLRLTLAKKSRIAVERRKNDWLISFSRKAIPIDNPLKPTFAKTQLGKPAILLPLKAASDPLRLLDNEEGSSIVIVPSPQRGAGVEEQRKFVDTTILPTYQGVAVIVEGDGVKVERTDRGVFVTSPAITMAKVLPEGISTGEEKDIPEPLPTPQPTPPKEVSMLPVGREYIISNSIFHAESAEFLYNITQAGSQEKNMHRLEYAGLNFRHGLYKEALGLLELMHQEDPTILDLPEVRLLQAASLYMNREYSQALRALNAIDVTTLPKNFASEVEFWQRAIGTQLGIESDPLGYLKHRYRFLNSYPASLRYHFAVLEANERLKVGDWKDAGLVVVNLEQERRFLKSAVLREMAYVNAVIELNRGDEAKAIKALEGLAMEVDDPYVRAKASFMLEEWLRGHGKITIPQAIDRLERTSMIWRGDILEYQVLRRLAALYKEQKRYREALRTWRNLLTYFPSTPDSLLISGEMTQLFTEIFTGDEAMQVPPLEALPIYYEFSEVSPPGEVGMKIADNIVNRLISMDLLDRATAMLTHQVKFRLSGEPRMRVAIRLTLLHLLDKKPQLALDVLNATEQENIPPRLLEKRKILRGQALSQLGKPKEALKVLEGDYGMEVSRLRADILWQHGEWSETVEMYYPKYDHYHRITEKLTPEEQEELLRLSIAFTMLQQPKELKLLYGWYSDKLDMESSNGRLIAFLTKKPERIDYAQLDKTLALGELQGFLDFYKKAIEEKGLAAAVGQ